MLTKRVSGQQVAAYRMEVRLHMAKPVVDQMVIARFLHGEFDMPQRIAHDRPVAGIVDRCDKRS